MKANGETLTEKQELDDEQSQTFSPRKEPFRNETWQEANERINRLQNELYEQGEKVKSSYRELVMKIKHNRRFVCAVCEEVKNFFKKINVFYTINNFLITFVFRKVIFEAIRLSFT